MIQCTACGEELFELHGNDGYIETVDKSGQTHVCAAKIDKDRQGLKHDTGKPRMELLPMDALYEIAKVLTSGAVKYGDENYKLVDTGRYRAAMLRHLAAIDRGESIDEGSGLSHYLHIAANAIFMAWRETCRG